MTTLTSSSMSSLSPPKYDTSAMASDKAQLRASLSLRTEWLSGNGLRFPIKRFVDLVGTLIGLMLLTPFMLVIALLIRLDSPGPVLFRQLRRGYGGRLFRVLKFRTMIVGAEQQIENLEESNESAGGVLFKLRNDPRITRLGWFLRRYSLDELPQLVNVLWGDMSLVGPRPLQLRDSDRLLALDPAAYNRRLQALPGLTGPWQIGGRSELNYESMVHLDLDYIEHWSLSQDLWIICKTFFVVLLGKGAY